MLISYPTPQLFPLSLSSRPPPEWPALLPCTFHGAIEAPGFSGALRSLLHFTCLMLRANGPRLEVPPGWKAPGSGVGGVKMPVSRGWISICALKRHRGSRRMILKRNNINASQSCENAHSQILFQLKTVGHIRLKIQLIFLLQLDALS